MKNWDMSIDTVNVWGFFSVLTPQPWSYPCEFCYCFVQYNCWSDWELLILSKASRTDPSLYPWNVFPSPACHPVCKIATATSKRPETRTLKNVRSHFLSKSWFQRFPVLILNCIYNKYVQRLVVKSSVSGSQHMSCGNVSYSFRECSSIWIFWV